jgi:hypothetical protein
VFLINIIKYCSQFSKWYRREKIKCKDVTNDEKVELLLAFILFFGDKLSDEENEVDAQAEEKGVIKCEKDEDEKE